MFDEQNIIDKDGSNQQSISKNKIAGDLCRELHVCIIFVSSLYLNTRQDDPYPSSLSL